MDIVEELDRRNADLRAEIERLRARLVDAGAFTLSERWSQQEADIERLQAMQQGYRDQSAHYMIENERLRAELGRRQQCPDCYYEWPSA